MAGKLAVQGAVPLQFNGYKIPLMRNLVKRAIGGGQEATWTSYSGQRSLGTECSHPHRVVLDLGGAASAVAFLIVHAVYVRYFAGEKEWPGTTAPESSRPIPERVPRHSLVGARCSTG